MSDATETVEVAKARFCKKEFDLDSGVVDFIFGDGETLSWNVYEFSDEIQNRLKLHGAIQKGGDSYAGAKGDYTAAKKSLRDTMDTIASGQWSASRGEGEAKPRTTELAAAIARIKGLPVEAVVDKVAAASDEQRKAWRALPQVKAQIAIIREEKARAALARAMKGGSNGLDFEV